MNSTRVAHLHYFFAIYLHLLVRQSNTKRQKKSQILAHGLFAEADENNVDTLGKFWEHFES